MVLLHRQLRRQPAELRPQPPALPVQLQPLQLAAVEGGARKALLGAAVVQLQVELAHGGGGVALAHHLTHGGPGWMWAVWGGRSVVGGESFGF
jgi:hypothetical protein